MLIKRFGAVLALVIFVLLCAPALADSWTEMHENGFRGETKDACKILNLSNEQCATYAQMLNTPGSCKTEENAVQNGMIVDVGFTRNGVHYLDKGVTVNLDDEQLRRDGMSRNAAVCYFDGMRIMKAFGCSNPIRDPNYKPEKLVQRQREVLPPRPNPYSCENFGEADDYHFTFAMLQQDFAAEECGLEAVLPHDGYLGRNDRRMGIGNPGAFSKTCTANLREKGLYGRVGLGTKRHPIEIDIEQMQPIAKANLEAMTPEDKALLYEMVRHNGHGVTYEGDIYEKLGRYPVFRGWIQGNTFIPATDKDKALISPDGKVITIPKDLFWIFDQDGNPAREMTEEERHQFVLVASFPDGSQVLSPPTGPSGGNIGVNEYLDRFLRGPCEVTAFAGIEMPEASSVAQTE